MIIVIFGYPGTGKTYVGKILEKYFNFYLYEGDIDMPESMKEKVIKQLPIRDHERDKLFDNIEKKIKGLKKIHKKLAVTQTFIKEKYRKQILKANPEAVFIYVATDEKIRRTRLAERKIVPLSQDYTDNMIRQFDDPEIKHLKIINDKNGEAKIKEQIKELFVI